MATGNMDIGKWLKDGLEIYKNNLALLIVATLLTNVIGGFTLGILYGPMAVGLYTIAIRLVDKSEPIPKIEDVFKRFDKFLPALVYSLLIGIIYIVGIFILAIIPGLGPILTKVFCVVWASLTIFGLPLIADRGLGFLPALQQSIATVKANFLPIIGFILLIGVVFFLLGLLGLFGSLIGILLIFPYVVAAVASAYRGNFPKQ